MDNSFRFGFLEQKSVTGPPADVLSHCHAAVFVPGVEWKEPKTDLIGHIMPLGCVDKESS